MELKNKSNPPISENAEFPVAHFGNVFAFDNNLARSRAIERSQQMQQRAFARTRWPDERHEFAFFERECKIAKHFDIDPPANGEPLR